MGLCHPLLVASLIDMAMQTDQAYPNGSFVDLSEEDSRGRTIPKPMIVASCHLIDGRRMYRLKDLEHVPYTNANGEDLFPEKKLGLSS